MMIVLLAEHVSMNVLLKQYQKATSIKSMQMFALTVVPVLMFALSRLFTLHKQKSKNLRLYRKIQPFLFAFLTAVIDLFPVQTTFRQSNIN
jgi:cytochrome bd-type quinol oxidase subunit 2